METKKVLVTGSLGYIGSVLVPYLTKKNYECIGYDTGFFKDCILYPPEEQKTVFKDVRQMKEEDLKDIDVLIHLAGISNDPFGKLKPEEVYDPTLIYSLHIAEMCKKLGVKFIFASSCSIYGKASEEILTEDSPANPQSQYSMNKLQIEDGLNQISNVNFSPIILRFATVFGPSPRMRFDLFINMFAGMALTINKIVLNSDGKAWRPNIYIEDVLKSIKYAVEYDPQVCEPVVLNVGDNSANFRVIDVTNMFKDILPKIEINFLLTQNYKISSTDYELIKDKKIQDGVDKRTYKVSFEKIKKTFKGFQCDWPVKAGILNLIKKLNTVELTEEKFKDINFYRLQKFEYLFKNRYISKELYWNK